MTGYARNELIGSRFAEYFVDAGRAAQGLRETLQKGVITDYVLTMRTRDGREVPVSLNASIFRDTAGSVRGMFASARDIAERTRFEGRLREQTVELERANQAKDRFLASMSHELRTPLNAIIGFTGTLLMQLPGPLNEAQEQQLSTIQSSGRHLLSLINDLLDLAKVESGKLELCPEPIDLRALAEEICETLRPLADRKSLPLRIKAPKKPVVLSADRRALHQILLNLSNNAIKFTEQGVVRLEIVRRDREVAVKVVDTGVGIKAEDMPKLFQAFEQVNGSAARRREGTGLGLHFSRKLAEALGGDIDVESTPGKGSTFTVRIPES